MSVGAMENSASATPTGNALLFKTLLLLVLLGLATLAITFAGRYFGKTLSLAGHTESRDLVRVVLGQHVASVPKNAIRFDSARRSGIANRLDLYLHWPSLEGYTTERRNDFNNVTTVRSVLFLTLEEQTMSRDMTGRFRPIYSSLIGQNPLERVGDVDVYPFKGNTGYVDETLAVANLTSGRPFVARCLSGEAARNSLAPCERDVLVADNLSVVYRFPRHLLPNWRELDAAVMAKMQDFLAGR